MLIMIHGTSCAGKSTLTKELAKHYPEFTIIRDYDLIKSKRLEFLQQVTGEIPRNGRERTELVVTLNSEQKNLYNRQKRLAIRASNQKVKELLDRGETVIYDTSALYTEDISFFDNQQKLMILVYAPLRIALERADLRKRRYVRNSMIRQRTKHTILSGFTLLYKPASEPLDSLTREEFDLLFKSDEIEFHGLQKAKKNAIRHFKFDQNTSCNIAPKLSYDLVLNSTKLTPEQSVEKVRALLN